MLWNAMEVNEFKPQTVRIVVGAARIRCVDQNEYGLQH